MSVAKLKSFLQAQVDDARAKGVLFSVHLKATMMKVSDPVIFGHVVSVFYKDVLAKRRRAQAGRLRPQQRHRRPVRKIQSLPAEQQAAITADIDAAYKTLPALAMVNSDRGITNLRAQRRDRRRLDAGHDPRLGQDGNAAGELQDAKAVIPDRCYAGVYQAVIEDCKANGAFNPVTMGSAQRRPDGPGRRGIRLA